MLVKYECITSSIALDFVAHVSDLGGSVCVIMKGNQPTSTVLTDFPFNKASHEFRGHVSPREVTDWDRRYFENAMK
jgi:hypothetical protein